MSLSKPYRVVVLIYLVNVYGLCSLHAQFQQNYGTEAEFGNAVVETYDKGFAAVGANSTGGTSGDIFVVRTDSVGNLLWQQTFGNTGFDAGLDIVESADSGLAITGRWADSLVVMKLNSAGVLQWNVFIPNAIGQAILEAPGEGYTVAGTIGSQINQMMLLTRITETGSIAWMNTSTLVPSAANDMVQTPDGGFALIGSSGSSNINTTLVRMDSVGVQQWAQVYASPGIQSGFFIELDPNDGFVFGEQDLIRRTDTLGVVDWSTTYPPMIPGLGSTFLNITGTSDGGYVLTGMQGCQSPGCQFLLGVKIDNAGNEVWRITYPSGFSSVGEGVIQASDGSLVYVGGTEVLDINQNLSVLLQLTKTDGQGTLSVFELPIERGELRVFPLPFNNVLHVQDVLSNAEYVLFSPTGAVTKTGKLVNGQINDLARLPNGSYTLTIRNGEQLLTKQLIKQ